MLPNFDKNFKTTSPYRDGTLTECLCCYQDFPRNNKTIFNDRIRAEILSDLFSTFGKYMKWESPQHHQFDFMEEQFPFCSSCSNILVRVFKLDQQIQSVISAVSSMIIYCKKKQGSNKRLDGALEKKTEFYRRQTLFQHELSVLLKPVEYEGPAMLKRGPFSVLPQPIASNEPLPSHEGDKVPTVPQSRSRHQKAAKKGKRDKPSNVSLKNHQNPQKQGFVCPVCSAAFSVKGNLKRHTLLRHTDESSKKFACQDCSRKFATSSLLKDHMRLHRRIPCPICGEIYPEVTMYIHKKERHRAQTVYKCKLCQQKSFPTRNGLTKHLKSCGRVTALPSDKKGGTDKRSAPPKFQCTFCRSVFSQRISLYDHVQRFHTPDKDKAFQCSVCGKKCATPTLLKRHFRNHEKVECDICNEIYSVNSLYVHKYVVHKSVECKLCFKTFKIDAIQEHIKWHKDQDPAVRVPPWYHRRSKPEIGSIHLRRQGTIKKAAR